MASGGGRAAVREYCDGRKFAGGASPAGTVIEWLIVWEGSLWQSWRMAGVRLWLYCMPQI